MNIESVSLNWNSCIHVSHILTQSLSILLYFLYVMQKHKELPIIIKNYIV